MVRIVGSRQQRRRQRYHLQTTVHQGALAVSGELHLLEQSLSDINEALTAAFLDLNDWVAANNGLIGHIKGVVQSLGKILLISTTGDEVNQRILESIDEDLEKSSISLTAIVFGIEQLALEEQLLVVFEKLEKSSE